MFIWILQVSYSVLILYQIPYLKHYANLYRNYMYRINLEMIKLKNKYVNIQHDFKFDSGVLDYITLSFSNTYFKDVKNI